MEPTPEEQTGHHGYDKSGNSGARQRSKKKKTQNQSVENAKIQLKA
jgi:hypothetical protein